MSACTDWQLRPTSEDRLTSNDYTDPAWDARILDGLAALSVALAPLVERLAGVLARFAGYDARFDTALRRAWAGGNEWVDRSDIDSCHRVWFQLHETSSQPSASTARPSTDLSFPSHADAPLAQKPMTPRPADSHAVVLPDYRPLVARTSTLQRGEGQAAYGCVRAIVIREGSAILFGDFGQKLPRLRWSSSGIVGGVRGPPAPGTIIDGTRPVRA